MRVDEQAVMVKKNTRRPEPAASISFDRVSSIERDHGDSFNVGKAIAVGLASGAGVVLALIFFAMLLDSRLRASPDVVRVEMYIYG